MSAASNFRWRGGALVEHADVATDARLVVADSWLVSEGRALALGLHRERFLRDAPGAESFWDEAIAKIPSTGNWFPRVEKHADGQLALRLRAAPERESTAVLATWPGADPRTRPSVKGPDLEAMAHVRQSVHPLGATEAVIVSDAGHVIEGAYSGLLWWRGDILCGPPADLPRVASVTTGSVITLATALGLDTHEELVTPDELDGTELWALNALHGIRIVTAWVDGPDLAEKPGRLAVWRARLDAIRRAI